MVKAIKAIFAASARAHMYMLCIRVNTCAVKIALIVEISESA